MQTNDAITERGKKVIRAEAKALESLENVLDSNFAAACRAIFATPRQLVVTGMGKSGHIGRKIAATFASTGTPAVFVHPGEAAHGDLGILASGDTLMVLSNSGSTTELRSVLAYATETGIPIIGIASQAESPVIRQADIPLILPTVREACVANIAPTTSTTMQLALGDALAVTVMDMRGITSDYLRSLHPGGSIGAALMPVRTIMHGTESLPIVTLDADMTETISVMTSGCFGMAGVIDSAGAIAGIITDGDLRRHFEILHTARAGEIMTRSPKLITPYMTVRDSLSFLNEHKITAAFIVEDPKTSAVPLGIIHIHDLLRIGVK